MTPTLRFTPEQGPPEQATASPWTPVTPTFSESVATFPCGLEIRAWSDGTALVSNPVPWGPTLKGYIQYGPTVLNITPLFNGTGRVIRPPAPPKVAVPLPQHAFLLESLPPAPYRVQINQLFHDDYPKPDIAGSPRIDQNEPPELRYPYRPESWEQCALWADTQALRPMIYKPGLSDSVGESGLGSASYWRNPDDGHLEVSRLAAGWLCFRDPAARYLLECYGRMILSRPLANTVTHWTGELRGVGYTLHDLAILELAIPSPSYRAAIERIVKAHNPGRLYGAPYPMLTNPKMGVGSHGYPSKSEVRWWFQDKSFPYNPAWDALPPKERIAAVTAKLKELGGGKATYLVAPGGLFDNVRPIVCWQLSILARGAALAHRVTEIKGLPDIIRHTLSCLFGPGMEPGFDSEENLVPSSPIPHDAYLAPWPWHKEPVKIATGGTTLWHIPALRAARDYVADPAPIDALLERLNA